MRLSVSLDDDLYAAVKALARAEDISLSEAVNALLRRSIFPIGEVPLPSVRNGVAVVDGRASFSSEDVRRAEEQLDAEHADYGAKR